MINLKKSDLSKKIEIRRNPYTGLNEPFVEVSMIYQLEVGCPCRGHDGELSFKEKEVNPEFNSIRIWVPLAVTKNEKVFDEYVTTAYRESFSDSGYLKELDIWDKQIPNESRNCTGNFVFDYQKDINPNWEYSGDMGNEGISAPYYV